MKVLRSGAKEVVFEEIQDCEEVCLFDHVQGDAVKEFLDLLMYVEEEGVAAPPVKEHYDGQHAILEV